MTEGIFDMASKKKISAPVVGMIINPDGTIDINRGPLYIADLNTDNAS